MVNSQLMKYFVLEPKSVTKDDVYAYASRRAIMVYANTISHVNSNLAKQLTDWVDLEVDMAVLLDCKIETESKKGERE